MKVSLAYRLIWSRVETPYLLYVFMRRAYGYTKGFSNSVLSSIISIFNPPYKQIENTNSEIFNLMAEDEIDTIVSAIETDGYHVFKRQLSSEQVDRLVDFAKKTPTRYLKPQPEIGKYEQTFSDEKLVYDPTRLDVVKWNFDSQDLIDSSEVQKYMFDPVLMKIAQKYLKSRPILDLVAMWWSRPARSEKEKAAAAQLFHFDMDRIKFLKFFFYLTNVTSETGPHCYVQGSHKQVPDIFYKDRRFSDQEVDVHFGNRVLELCGTKGTIIAVDTRGLHKGLSLVRDERLLFQLEFANSMFGQNYEKLSGEYIEPKYKSWIQRYPMTYLPLFNRREIRHFSE